MIPCNSSSLICFDINVDIERTNSGEMCLMFVYHVCFVLVSRLILWTWHEQGFVCMYDKSSYSSQTIAMHASPTALVSVTNFLTPTRCALRWCNITQIAHTRKKSCHTSGHCFKLFPDNFHTSSQFPQHILQLLTYSASTWYIRRISLWKSLYLWETVIHGWIHRAILHFAHWNMDSFLRM